jgi:hypothetical protein
MLTETASTNSTIDSAESLHVNRLPQFESAAAKPTPKPKLSPAERSRQNGRKSKGPRTEAGKARVRYNALKHGITAKSLFLPGEDASEFETQCAALHTQIRPRNELEAEMLNRLAHDLWVSRRAKLAAAAQLQYRLRHEPRAAARAEQQQVSKLAQYLLKDVFRSVGVKPCEQAGGARHPAQVVLKLEATLTGCNWLLARFDRLKEHASIPGNWLENDGLELVRLMGKYRGELISDDVVAMVLLDSERIAEEAISRANAYCDARDRTLEAGLANAHAEAAEANAAEAIPARIPSEGSDALDELDEDDAEPTLDEQIQFFNGPACQEYRRLARDLGRAKRVLDEALRLVPNQPSLGPCVLRLEKLNPKSIEQARKRLTVVIDEHAQRVRAIRDLHAEIQAADDARAAERIAFGPGPEGERERNYVLAHDRHVIRSVGTFLKVRKAGDDGTLDEVVAEDLLHLAAEAPQPEIEDPSLALRAGIEPPAPAETEPTHTSPFDCALGEPFDCALDEPTRERGSATMPAETEPDHTSPTRERGFATMPAETEPTHQRRLGEETEMTAQLVSQALCEEIVCAEPPQKCNKPRSTPAPRAEQVSREQLTVDQTTANRSTAVTCSTDQLLKSLAGANDKGPITKEEMQKKRFDALPYAIRNEIENIRRQLWIHNGRPYLRKDQISEFVAFIDKHLGEDSIGPESPLRASRQNP